MKVRTLKETLGTSSSCYLLWSLSRGAWWCPEAAGYTESAAEAGIYSKRDSRHYESIDHVAIPLLPHAPPTWLEVKDLCLKEGVSESLAGCLASAIVERILRGKK